jgi:hypothetical protein
MYYPRPAIWQLPFDPTRSIIRVGRIISLEPPVVPRAKRSISHYKIKFAEEWTRVCFAEIYA